MMDASFLKSQHPVVEELLTNKYFGDTLLVCSNGHLTDNKLAVGLLFPCLLSSDVFALPIENVLLVPDYTMEEIGREFEKLVIGSTLKETYEAALQAKALQASQAEEADIVNTSTTSSCPDPGMSPCGDTNTGEETILPDIEQTGIVIDESVIENMNEGDYLVIGDSSVSRDTDFEIYCDNVQIGKTFGDKGEMMASFESSSSESSNKTNDTVKPTRKDEDEFFELTNVLEIVPEMSENVDHRNDNDYNTDGDAPSIIPVLRPEKPLVAKKSVTFKEPLDPPELIREETPKRRPIRQKRERRNSNSKYSSRSNRLKLKIEESNDMIYIENLPGLPSDNEENEEDKDSNEECKTERRECRSRERKTESEVESDKVLINRKPGRPRTRSDTSPKKNEDGLTKFKVKSAEWVSKGRFKCGICSKVLSCQGSLERHKKIHLDDRPHKCQFCPKMFRESGKKQVHERVHTGSKPFQCQQCNKSFRTSTQRMVHIRSHTKEKPFSCKFCGKNFGQSYSVNVHINNFHKDKTEQNPFVILSNIGQ